MQYLTKEELMDKLEDFELYPELKNQLDSHLSDHIHNHDVNFIEMLLKAGANPNSSGNLNDFLRSLLEQFKNEKDTNGKEILRTIEVLLKYGADPNKVADNNLRAYDYAVSSRTKEVIGLLEKYGADKKRREAI